MFEWIPKETLKALGALDLSLTVHSVPEINTLLSKTVLFRGKRLRPTLCFLMGQLLGVSSSKLQPYARAAEFVHAATLAHDDVIDESKMRRRRPTLNVLTSNVRAVLAGDLLLARVMTELSALGEVEIIHHLSQTVEELVSGEWLQLESNQVIFVDKCHLEKVARMKTASLMIWCCVTPARLAGYSASFQQLCSHYAEYLGLAFQMVDDVLDYQDNAEKPFAQDLHHGLMNSVSVELLQNNQSLFNSIQKCLEGKAVSRLDWPWTAEELKFACQNIRISAKAKLEVADQILAQMTKELNSIRSDALNAFQGISFYLRERIQ